MGDLPHPDCGAWWWYFHTHLTTKTCYEDAKARVDGAEGKLDSLLPNSFMKVTVRALGVDGTLREAE